MHYRNGREAKDGDQVITKLKYGNGDVVTGRLTDLAGSQTSCNGTLVRTLGAPLSCITVGDYYHAEDAWAAIEAAQAAKAAAQPELAAAAPAMGAEGKKLKASIP